MAGGACDELRRRDLRRHLRFVHVLVRIRRERCAESRRGGTRVPAREESLCNDHRRRFAMVEGAEGLEGNLAAAGKEVEQARALSRRSAEAVQYRREAEWRLHRPRLTIRRERLLQDDGYLHPRGAGLRL